MKTYYKISSTGAIQEWSISGSIESETITITYGQKDGAKQTQTDIVGLNQSGRGMREQMLLEIRSRISRQKAKGYRNTIEEARNHQNQNELNLAKPMLAQRFDKISHINLDSAFRQYKYDGHRMLVHHTMDGEYIAYSRNGKIIDTLDHIVDGLDIPRGETIDGEVYAHGQSLQTIASWCKRKQENTAKLFYQVYDVIRPHDYESRLRSLESFDLGSHASIVPTWRGGTSIRENLMEAIELGYEGLILRPSGGYEAGKRSRNLVKVKQVLDDEFLVLDVIESRDNWGILVCQTGEGNVFRVSAPGGIDHKRMILEKKELFIGLMVRVEYFSLTKDRIPFHPVAISFRDKFDE